RAMPDFDIAEDLRAGADHDAVADLRMAVAGFLAAAAQGDAVQERNVVFDHRGFTDHQAGGVIEENTAADPRRRMDVALKDRRRAALQVEREVAPTLVPEPVCQPIGLDGMEAFIVEHRLDHPMGRRVAVAGRHDVGAENLAERGFVPQRVHVRLPDQTAGQGRMVEPLRQPVDYRGLERVVMQDRRVDEARQFGLAADDLLGLAPNACPNRINRIERRLCLILRHSTLSRTPGGLNPGRLAYIGTRSGETKACGAIWPATTATDQARPKT